MIYATHQILEATSLSLLYNYSSLMVYSISISLSPGLLHFLSFLCHAHKYTFLLRLLFIYKTLQFCSHLLDPPTIYCNTSPLLLLGDACNPIISPSFWVTTNLFSLPPESCLHYLFSKPSGQSYSLWEVMGTLSSCGVLFRDTFSLLPGLQTSWPQYKSIAKEARHMAGHF